MIPQIAFRFFGSLEGSFLTAAEPTTFAYNPRSSVYSSSTALYEERGPRIIEPQPTRATASEHSKAAAAQSGSKQGDSSSEASSRSSSRSASPRRPTGVDLLSSAPRMNATRLVG